MKVYQFHPVSGDYMGESIADESPLESGVFLIPAHSTTEEPPVYDKETQVCKREGTQENGVWAIYSIEESLAKSEKLVHGYTPEQIAERDRRDAEIKKQHEEANAQKREILKKLGLSDEDIEKFLVIV
jgi:hypothetical protein